MPLFRLGSHNESATTLTVNVVLAPDPADLISATNNPLALERFPAFNNAIGLIVLTTWMRLI